MNHNQLKSLNLFLAGTFRPDFQDDGGVCCSAKEEIISFPT